MVLVVESRNFGATFISPLKKARFHCPSSMTQGSETAAYCLVPALNQPCSQEMEPNACLKKRGLGNPARWATGKGYSCLSHTLKRSALFLHPFIY